MITRTTFAGFGGQGVLLMGYILSHGAMLKGLNVTYFPSYGAEMRGGTANCTVSLSDKKIASPVASNPDILVAMNFPSLEKFESMVINKGLIFINASLIEENPSGPDVEVLRVPTLELAREAGSERAINMVMVGALVAKTDLLSLEETVHGMHAALKGKEKMFPLNEKVVNPGFVRTPMTAQNDFRMPALIEPTEAAGEIVKGLEQGEFEIHFPKRFTRFLKLLRVLPYGRYFPAVRKATGL